MLSKFSKISASFTAAILKSKAGEISGMSYELPSDITEKAYSYVATGENLTKLKEKDIEAFNEFLQLRNIFRFFGKTSPTFSTENGALKSMYAPSIYSPTEQITSEIGNCDFIIKFGNTSIPLVWDSEREKFTATNGKASIHVKPAKTKIATQAGELEVAIGECYINGSDKSSDRFYCRIGVKRDANDKRKEMVPGFQIESWMENGDIKQLKEVVSNPPTGGTGWTYRWEDEKFPFGKYPVVGLVKEFRKGEAGKSSWYNHCVVVVTPNGEHAKILTNNLTVWGTLNAYYPYIDEKGNVFNKSDDFTAAMLGDEESNTDTKCCVVYRNKRQYVSNRNGQQSIKYEIDLTFEESDITKYEPLSEPTKQLATVGAPSKQFVPGVDDLTEDVMDNF